METSTVLALLKARLGISTSIRDTYLSAIIEGITEEMQGVFGVKLEAENNLHLMFVVDLASWRYQSRDSDRGMPRHLQYRLHNLIVKGVKGDGEGV